MAGATSVSNQDSMARLNLWLARRVFRMKASDRADLYDTIQFYLDNYKFETTLAALAERRLARQEMYGFMLAEWLHALRSGRSLSSVMIEWLPADEATIINVNAREKKDKEGFALAKLLADSKASMIGSIAGQLAMPVIAILMVCGMIAMIGVSLVPQLVKGQDVDKWPWAGQAVVGISDFIINWSWALGIGVIVAFGLITYSIGRLRPDSPGLGPMRPILDHIPPWSIYKTISGAAFLLSLASLLKAKVELKPAIAELMRSSNPYVRYYLELMDDGLSSGQYTVIADCGLLEDNTANTIADFLKLSDSFDIAVEKMGNKSVEFALKRMAILSASLSALMGFVFIMTLMFFIYGISSAFLSVYTNFSV